MFFVWAADESLGFSTQTLGLPLTGITKYVGPSRDLCGFEVILNQVYGLTQNRAGQGRAFIGLGDQSPALLQHIREQGLIALIGW